MKRCEECNQVKSELPVLIEYNDERMHVTEERRTCEDCWLELIKKVNVIATGHEMHRHGIKYKRLVHVIGNPISGQLELF